MRQHDAAVINRKSPHFPVALSLGTSTVGPRRFSPGTLNYP